MNVQLYALIQHFVFSIFEWMLIWAIIITFLRTIRKFYTYDCQPKGIPILPRSIFCSDASYQNTILMCTAKTFLLSSDKITPLLSLTRPRRKLESCLHIQVLFTLPCTVLIVVPLQVDVWGNLVFLLPHLFAFLENMKSLLPHQYFWQIWNQAKADVDFYIYQGIAPRFISPTDLTFSGLKSSASKSKKKTLQNFYIVEMLAIKSWSYIFPNTRIDTCQLFPKSLPAAVSK